jgi:hypothetical protein
LRFFPFSTFPQPIFQLVDCRVGKENRGPETVER